MVKDWITTCFEQDLVSVVIPCYNKERFLSSCLESVFGQEYRPLEVIIVDDGSSDGTRQIMDDFQSAEQEDLTVKCLYQSNHGAQNARNRGCQQARGEFIQFLDGDDVLCRGKLSAQVAVLKNDKAVDVVYGDGQYIVDLGGSQKNGKIISIGFSSDIVESLLEGLWVPPFSYLCRRSAVQRCGPWDESIQIVQDFEYFLRMAMQGNRFFYKDGVTGLYRKHAYLSISEQPVPFRERTRLEILAQAEHRLRNQGGLNESRIYAMVKSYRRIARQTYLTDTECFKNSLDNVLRLCPQYLPEKAIARLGSKMLGFLYYERVAAMVRHIFYRRESDWL